MNSDQLSFNHFHHLVLVLLLLLFSNHFLVSHSSCHDDERAALLTFKSFLTDPWNRLSSWQVGRNCCNWYGIECSHESFHVVSLDLRNTISPSFINYSIYRPNVLNGTISQSLFNLTHLQHLDLSNNDFQFSKIPHQFANLKDLTYLNLSYSKFSGSITTQFANLSSLQYLDISCYDSYSVSSKSVSWLRGLVNLKVLSLASVDLSEASSAAPMTWAKPISYLSHLRQLDFSECFISSPFPAYVFLNLSRLSSLRMSYNNFLNSSIPLQFSNLTSLSVLDLSECEIQGSISYLPQLKELYVYKNPNLIVNLTWMFDHHEWRKLQTLSIYNTEVNGPIPSSISNASSLVSLDASFCYINGPIPSSFSNLSQLQNLELSYNNLQGPIPSSFSNLSQLQNLDLSSNQNLTGYLHSLISNLRNLEYLELSDNNIQGSIPESICQNSFLQVIGLYHNNLTGTIPSCISKLQNLYRFEVNYNSIGGTVSLIPLINKLNLLTGIDLGSNRITVEIDEHSLLSKPQLQSLRLTSCNMSGYIPASFCNLTELRGLDLADNNLTGVIPSCLFKLPSLTFLDLSNNNLQGTLPHSLYGEQELFFLNLAKNNLQGPLPLPPLKNREYFDLSHNKFTGEISIKIGKILSNIQYVSLSGNRLSGSIPFSICSNGSRLVFLDLSNNSLSGRIPSTLKYCNSLSFLNLGMNKLTGNIPNELERATKLIYLQLNDNNLNGTFPSYIQKFEDLQVLILGNNNFEGTIPSVIGSLHKLIILSLRLNKLNGSIPEEITHLSKLQFLDLSRNNLSSLIPMKMANLEMLRNRTNSKVLVDVVQLAFGYRVKMELQIVNKGTTQNTEIKYNSGIDLSCNILEGQIPEEMVLLKGLAMLNLSHNRLSGKIPRNIGDMTTLESLDLSVNNLSGGIPQSLVSINFLQSLNLSYNNLSGRIPTEPHFDTLSGDGDSAYTGNNFLCGTPPRKSCEEGDPGPSSDNAQVRDGEEEDVREKWLLYSVIFLGFVIGFWGLFLVLLRKKEKWWFGYWRVVDKIVVRMVGCISKH